MASKASRSGGGQMVGSIQYCPPESSCMPGGNCVFSAVKSALELIVFPGASYRSASRLHISGRNHAVKAKLDGVGHALEVHQRDLRLRPRIVDALAEGIRPPLRHP